MSGDTSEQNASRGRLYRSTGADGPQAEVARPAVAKRRAPVEDDGVAAAVWSPEPMTSTSSAALPIPPGTRKSSGRIQPALTVPGLIVLNVVVVTLVALLNVFITNPHRIGTLTSIVFVICAIIGALFVRIDDPNPAWIIPPLGYFVAVLIAGQFALPTQKHLIIREGAMIATTLGFNALWILGGTLAAFVIVQVRKRRS